MRMKVFRFVLGKPFLVAVSLWVLSLWADPWRIAGHTLHSSFSDLPESWWWWEWRHFSVVDSFSSGCTDWSSARTTNLFHKCVIIKYSLRNVSSLKQRETIRLHTGDSCRTRLSSHPVLATGTSGLWNVKSLWAVSHFHLIPVWLQKIQLVVSVIIFWSTRWYQYVSLTKTQRYLVCYNEG